jgi:hypothetical protein
VESCTAVVEGFDGRLEIVHWLSARRLLAAGPPRLAALLAA